MPIPETTSVEAFERYVGGTCLRAGRGKAWREDKALLLAPGRQVEGVTLPAVSEPFLEWTVSGEVEFEEREGERPWLRHRLGRGSMFLASGGAPYECRWRVLGTLKGRRREGDLYTGVRPRAKSPKPTDAGVGGLRRDVSDRRAAGWCRT